MNLCACGCGRPVKVKYAPGHNRKGIRPWNKGLTKEIDARVVSPWNKGLTKEIDARVVKPIEVIERQRASIMGKNKGRVFGDDFREMRRRMMLGAHHTEESKKKRSQAMKAKISNGEWFPKIPLNPWPKPNKTEAKLLALLNKHFPNQYKYTGDGSLCIDKLTPDFANCDGRKEVIELYGDHWHRGENPQDKIDRYAKFGFRCLVLWERELKDEERVLSKLEGFRR